MIEYRQLDTVLDDVLETVVARKELGGIDLFGIPTGFSHVDTHTGGIQPDQAWIIAGSTSTGKTAMSLDMALSAARSGSRVLFYALEMSAPVLVNRLLSTWTEIPAGRIVRGKVTDDEYARLCEVGGRLKGLDFAIIDQSMTSAELMEHAQRLGDERPVDLVFVDYANLLRDPNVHGEAERAAQISLNLRALARPDYLDCGVVTLAQLNRASQAREDRRPKLHDLKGTSNFEQDAHVVLLLYRPSIERREQGAAPQQIETDAEIIIAKNREGLSGISTPATFTPSTMKWSQ